jgi:hypothetical protein
VAFNTETFTSISKDEFIGIAGRFSGQHLGCFDVTLPAGFFDLLVLAHQR